MTAALYNLATPKVWSWISAAGTSCVVPPVNTAGWETVYFGVNSNYGATAFELNTPTFKTPAETVETNLRIQDYAGGVPHDFVYHLLKGMIPHEYNLANDKKFWLKASIVSYGMGEQWLYGGWSWVGGQPGVLPPSSPGVFNFSLQMQGARGEHRFTLTPPDQSAGGLLGGGFTGTKTLLDPWHPEAPTWTTPASTRTSALFYSGPVGATDGWLLRDEDSGDTHLLYPQALTNFTVDLTGWLLPPVPMNLQVSASRFGHLLYLRQKDRLSSSFMVDPYAMQGSFVQFGGQTYYTPYYYFEAVASRRDDQWVDYWVHDDTTGEDSPANQPMLINWISTPTPSAPTITEHGDTLEARWPQGYASSLGAYRLERKAAADTEWIVVAEVPADTADAEHWVTQLDQPTDPSLSFQYRLAYLFGGQISAYSPVTPFHWQDSDGDGLPDSWELAWGLDRNIAQPSHTWLVGFGLTAMQVFNQHVPPPGGDVPPTWNGKKRLHAYHYLAGGGGHGVVWQDWEGDAVYTANVIVEQEVSEGSGGKLARQQ